MGPQRMYSLTVWVRRLLVANLLVFLVQKTLLTDPKYLKAFGFDPVEALRQLRPYVKAVHLKDVARANDDKNVVLGTGVARSAALIEELKRQRFAGLVAIEYEEGVDPQPDVARCVEFARRLM